MARQAARGGDWEASPPQLPEDIAADRDVDATSGARTICLKLLTVRSRTRQELAEALRSRGIADDGADEVLARFADVGLIDDAAFAENFARARLADRGLAGREIARQLRAKGVSEPDVCSALSQVDTTSERAMARQLADRKVRSMAGLAPAVQTRRVVGLLARKGYSPGLAFEVVREVVKDADLGEPADDTAWPA